ncbi:antitoxin VbhA family protein [Brevibacterium litoralis]|uniref:antitoxin VbhA family protein n=1 Tax=Brevibacterium litoralis TaxID=3138935 RepID=UPI0032EBE209
MDAAERRDLVIDTFASLALEGMEPTRRDLDEALEYIEGRVTIAELIERAKEQYGVG